MAITVGIGTMFASAMAPAHAAPMPAKPVVAKKKAPDVAKTPQAQAGRGAPTGSPFSLQWIIGAGLRP